MRALIQRAKQARVEIGGEIVGAIGEGLVVFLGIRQGDTPAEAAWLADKCLELRIFEDGEGKMNRSVRDLRGGLLVISQFTLYGDARRGRRPGFTAAAPPALAIPLHETFLRELRKAGLPVESGRFGAEMEVYLQNHGPVTLLLEREAAGPFQESKHEP
ncbi:MAG: D-aminoacyl-tRNA deacylase [Lentisphaeria bacterium]|jgi:D-tyrosyl-tRNA(Tyr) deacylase